MDEQTSNTKTFATGISYQKDTDGEWIVIGIVGDKYIKLTPEELLNPLDECLLMRLKQTELLKFGTLTKLMKRLEELSVQAKDAKNKFALLKIKQEKECLAQMRYLVKYKEMEQRRIKEEMLERQM